MQVENNVENLGSGERCLDHLLTSLAVLLALMLTGCSVPFRQSEVDLHTLNFAPMCQVVMPRGLEWDANAYMVSVSLPIWEGETDTRLFAAFGFRSVSDRQKWLNIYVRLTGETAAEISMEEGIFTTPRPEGNPVREICSLLGSQEALGIIEQQGAGGFLARYQGSTESRLHLEYSQPYFETLPMEWRGRFSSTAGADFLTVVVNAHSGEFVEAFDPTNR